MTQIGLNNKLLAFGQQVEIGANGGELALPTQQTVFPSISSQNHPPPTALMRRNDGEHVYLGAGREKEIKMHPQLCQWAIRWAWQTVQHLI